MTTNITNATTYSLDSSYADLKHLVPLSYEEWRTLLACLPTTHSATAVDSWKQGFLCGWCMAWQSQPFLDEQAEEAAQTLAAPVPWKRRKGTHACVPRYPNALRSCIKQAGYSFREAPGRRLFQKARSTVGLRASRSFRMRSANDLRT